MSFQDAIFATPDGAEIAYRIRPGRAPIVLLHGLGCDGSMWDGVVAALPRDVGLVLPDARGHGGSSLGWRAPAVSLWADDVVRLARAAGVERPAIAGLSMGGYSALAIAGEYPGLARAYAFVSTTAAPDDDEGRKRRAAGIALIRREGWRAYAHGLIPGLLNDRNPSYTTHHRHLVTMFARAGDSGLPPALMALAARRDRRAVLASIQEPSIAVVGSEDKLIPPDRSREIASGIPGARLHVLEGAAHMSAMEAPDEVAALLATL